MEAEAIIAAVQEHGSVSAAARVLGVPRRTLSDRLRRARNKVIVQQKEERREIQGSSFWRARTKVLMKDLSNIEFLAEQLAGIRQAPVTIPEWMLTKPQDKLRSIVGCFVSDVHAGEVVAPGEISGINEFNIDICRERLRKLFSRAVQYGTRWGADTNIVGCLLALGGDLISGDIHEELRITNELTSLEQVRFVVGELVAGALQLAEAFGAVHVPCVPGNHGRTTIKSTAKLYSRLSYDTMIGDMVRERLQHDPRFTWDISAGTDSITPIFGKVLLLTHGDKMGTGGGQGFAGPMLPIVRGTKKVQAQQSFLGQRPDLILSGHYHSSGNPYGVLANGSIPGYTEFGNLLRAGVDPAQQWCFLLTDGDEFLRDRTEVVLSEVGRGVRSSIPPFMAA